MTVSTPEPQDLARLFAVADLLVPTGTNMPSASQADPDGAWTRHVLSIRPDLADAVERALGRAARVKSFTELDKALADDPGAFAALTLVVAGAYYLNPEIRRRVGYPGQVAQLSAEWAFDTEALIERVIARGPVYRPTPSELKKGGER